MAQTQVSRAPVSLAQIGLRRNERGFVVGGVGAGKSTLMEMLGREFVTHYHRLGARRLILDSKPRYRAEWTAQGISAKKRYKKWGHGQYVPGSVVVDDVRDLDLAWKTGTRTVIVQCESSADIGRLVAAASSFLRSSRAGRPQLLQVDETLDFFHGNGADRGGDDAVKRTVRAGRERGTAALLGSQRTKGLPPTVMEEMDRLYCLRIDFKADAKRLQEMGAPDFPVPTAKHQFMYWTKEDYTHVWGPYQLDLKAAA